MLLIIIALTGFLSWRAFEDQTLRDRLLLIPYKVRHQNEWHRLFTHAFIHADWSHLMFNLLTLYFIGSYLEAIWIDAFGPEKGNFYFVALYFIGILAATLWTMLRYQDNPAYRSLGASGAVSAVLFAFILWSPTQTLSLMFIPIPIPAYIFGPLYIAYEYFAFKKSNTGIAHEAHLGGAIFGILFVLLIAPEKGMQFVHLFV
ncbi:MAG: hypothetical protein RLZZ301_1417 [Bacteroidota bacterium]|jgi:membrane associated rhomboid family serine protease